MKPEFNSDDLGELQAQLDQESLDRAKRIAATNDWLVRLREESLRDEIARTRNDPRFGRVNEAAEALIKALDGWQSVKDRGGDSAARYWQREVEPFLARLQKGPEARLWRDLFREGDLGRGGWEQEFAARMLDRDPDRTRFIIDYDAYGARTFWEPQPDPVPPAKEEVGVIRQALEPPLDLGRSAPFDFVVGAKADSGLAINTSAIGGSVAGNGFVSAQSLALVVMGGGAHAQTLIGATFAIPAGYQTLDCFASVDIAFTGMSIAILGGSTASMNSAVRVQMSDGRTFRTGLLLRAIPSPLLCYRETSGSIPNVGGLISGIPLSGAAEVIRVFVGVEVYSAAGGLVGSAGARMSASFSVSRMWISAR